ncbi:MAG: DUF5317 family protein [Candidatus Liptonbacteria bacterium]|nr:DUF5317 family protein [Candidatus Liptonbacteria bacterium]
MLSKLSWIWYVFVFAFAFSAQPIIPFPAFILSHFILFCLFVVAAVLTDRFGLGKLVTSAKVSLLIGATTTLLLFLMINPVYSSRYIFLLGAFSNLLVISVNGFKMPVNTEAREAAGFERSPKGIYVLENEKTRLRWLCDRVYSPRFLDEGGILSIGDIFLDISLLIMVVQQSYYLIRACLDKI